MKFFSPDIIFPLFADGGVRYSYLVKYDHLIILAFMRKSISYPIKCRSFDIAYYS